MRFILLIAFLTVTSLCAQIDLIVTKQYTQKDGLSNSTIYCIYQDSRGFLWIGTKEGLNRFDGYRFKQYYHEKHNPESLPHNRVADIIEIRSGILLLATGSGLSVLNTNSGQFENERVRFAPLAAGSGSTVTSLYMDPERKIWVNHSGEMDIFDDKLNYLYRFSDLEWAHDLKGVNIAYEDWFTDLRGRLWLPTDTSGIQIIDFTNKTIYNREHNPNHLAYLEYKFIRAFSIDEKRNTLLVAPWGGGIYKYDLQSGHKRFQTFDQSVGAEGGSVNSILQLANGNILCSSNGILFEMDPGTMMYHTVGSGIPVHSSTPDNHVLTITKVNSNEQQYCIGSLSGLIFLEERNQQQPVIFPASIANANCIDIIVRSTGEVYSMYDNAVLIETDRQRTSFKEYSIPLDISHLYLTQLCEDKKQQLWIGSTRGILIFDMKSKRFRKAPVLAAETGTYINTIFCDRDGDMWIGTRGPLNLFCYHHEENSFQKIENEMIDQISSVGSNARISSIVQDTKGYLWMRSVVGGGILRYDKTNDEWILYPGDENEVSFLINKGISSLYPDMKGNIWFSTTMGDGLTRFNYTTNQSERFSREDGILSDYITHILSDQNYLWLTTEYGISQFNLQDHKVTSHDVPNIAYPFDVAIDTLRHELALGMRGKQVFIPTTENKIALLPPVPVIDGIYVNHKDQNIDPGITKLKLKHDQKNITIDFTSAYYTDADKLQFAYFLEGADHAWQYPKNTRTAQYAALSSGNYTFKLKVADPNGNWGESIHAFSFTIIPPFWKTIWFFVCLCIVLGSILFLIVRKRIKNIRYEAGLKQKIADTEMMALRAQMNPHFIFNSLNNIDALIHSNDQYHATLYLNKFAKLIRNVLDASKQNTVSFAKDIETLQLYIELEQFRNEKSFKVDMQIDPALYHEDCRIPPLIVQPYVENAILHGLRHKSEKDGLLSIKVNKVNGDLQYLIEDNGVGRAYALKGHENGNGKISYGMQMSSDRIRIFNREHIPSVHITDLQKNGQPSGTKVEIKLKMKTQ